ncbi:MAG: hypothetical protein L3J51_04750 [Cocleimonas sp.]|nr:hypothetical protein [Cocleimonas sp.]
MTKILPLWLSALIKEILAITFNLFKIMIPIIIIVKIIQELGGIKYIGMVLEPIMELVGLPASMGLVWATTMISNIYAGMIIFINTNQDNLSVAQVTILASMMLLAHALPIEVRIAQKAGVRVLFTLVLRIGGALLLGFILHQIYTTGDYLSQTNQPLWKPPQVTDDSLLTWAINQVKMLFQVFIIIAVLVAFLRLLKFSGIERLFAFLLKPFLKILGLTEKTTSITIVGITLGLTYGGGLLINEANKGELSKMDVFGSISLLAIGHSLIEDTLLLMLLGAHLSGILYARILFSIILIALIIHSVKRLNQTSFERFFVYPKKPQDL